ncbi:ABC transporter ATP-binding protein [Streptomyces kronopolitis]|uniref:ABC transporter ATP-binding protein n=1 Tax=Streptomyces kronopolitis TaxID=1612435 RepID=A0ABQ2JA53_9ACTN|nr:ATP-binding cassette domain-containing protein [Streptomyces kronopolitis]GGN43398.1 ABC transporter ATP-binding protein [Streptomyces kronopolitis]
MLELEELVRDFGSHRAVSQVSFRVSGGRLTGFVGSNGAGKTTTMRMIMGVLAAHGGDIRWEGAPVTAADRRNFGYMPEERGLYPKQTVLSQLLYLARLRGQSTADARRHLLELLERLGLAEKSQSRLESLSLGNQQRVQIAAALLGSPELLVLDEPFSGLDPHAVDTMAELLREYADAGIPVLFSSHQLDLVERLCDDLVIMATGCVVAKGTADELRHRDKPRYQLVTGAPAHWARTVPGVTDAEVLPDGARVELAADTDPGALLAEALRRGAVYAFTPLVPSIADVYREMTSA